MTASMDGGAGAPLGGPRHPLALGKKRIEDSQDCLLAGFDKGAAGDVLGVLKKLFGLGHSGLRRFDAASVRGQSCMCMHSFLKKVERK